MEGRSALRRLGIVPERPSPFPRVCEVPLAEGFCQACSREEVELRLTQLPQAHLVGLRAVVLLGGTRRQEVCWRGNLSCYGFYSEGVVFLCAIPRAMGTWTFEEKRDFYLHDVLPHEVGHHVDSGRNMGRADKEAFAHSYADRHGQNRASSRGSKSVQHGARPIDGVEPVGPEKSDEPDRLYSRSIRSIESNTEAGNRLAFSLNQEAALLGHNDAILSMGWFYLNGIGIDRDIELARKWYRRSARRGSSAAMFSLGHIEELEGEFPSARDWYEMAAKRGDADAWYRLGRLYWRGYGVPRDARVAGRYFVLAGEAGAKVAKRFLRRARQKGSETST